MITKDDLISAIAECQGQRDPNANTCIKLAAYYTILNNMYEMRESEVPVYSTASKPAGQVSYDSGSEFSEAIEGKDLQDVLGVIDELMDAVQVMIPKLYRATISKLGDL